MKARTVQRLGELAGTAIGVSLLLAMFAACICLASQGLRHEFGDNGLPVNPDNADPALFRDESAPLIIEEGDDATTDCPLYEDGSFIMSQPAFEARYFRGRESVNSGGAYETYCSDFYQHHPK